MSRCAFAYVVSIEGAHITLNLLNEHKGQLAAHRHGIGSVTDVGSMFGVRAGSRLLVLRVQALKFAEPKEVHDASVKTHFDNEPLRNLLAVVVGFIDKGENQLRFFPDSQSSPALGAEAFPLTPKELDVITNGARTDQKMISLGLSSRSGTSFNVTLNNLLSRHVAVLGGTGQGKSSFTAAILQQVMRYPRSRIVLFDINGEYEQALNTHIAQDKLLVTRFGNDPNAKIPYYALGRHGLGRLLLPSEKTQRPALNFALENLQFVEWSVNHQAARVVGENDYNLVEDCRPGDANSAARSINKLRARTQLVSATRWPSMMALAALAAESYSIKPSNRQGGGFERGGFEYGNISPLVNRIRRFVEDPQFTSVIDVGEGPPCTGPLSWQAESSNVIDKIFGSNSTQWNVHIVDLRSVAHDLLPLILGSLLELFAFELFKRGQGRTYPTLLVLEEAHHYLRQLSDSDEVGKHSLAYERLAKEGRKFGVSIWLSTQRPSELSPTVLAQCGTWVVFRLSSEQDLRAVSVAAEWVDKQEVSRIPGLPRRTAIVFGGVASLPTKVVSPPASPPPRSHDPEFNRWEYTDEEWLEYIMS